MEAQEISTLPRHNFLAALHRILVAPVVDFIYPPVCLSCNTLLEQGRRLVCDRCWNSFRLIESDDQTLREVSERLAAGGNVERIFSCFLFEKEGALQDVVHALKYSGMKSLGRRLGQELGVRLLENQAFAEADYLVPVPLHRTKRRERGYNQAEHICLGVADAAPIPVLPSLLVRTRYTQSQTKLTIGERAANVAGAFGIDPARRQLVKGRTLILVDDVITTGATIEACAAELRRAGVGVVLAASIALAP